jgi:hypothetical protein
MTAPALPDVGQVDEPVNRPQQVIGRHVPLQAEPAEQGRLRGRPLTYHQHVSARSEN